MNRYGQVTAPAAPMYPASYGQTPGQPATPPPAAPDYVYCPRYGTNTPKGLGYFGPLALPDGGVKGEWSVGVTIDGKQTEIPSIVPTLTKDELAKILTMKPSDPWPPSVLQKAIAHARQRIAAGKDPFAGPGEQDLS